jgi:hypothetical protein
MTTARVLPIQTLGDIATPDVSRVTLFSPLAMVVTSLLAAHRERQAAEVERVLRQGLAAH